MMQANIDKTTQKKMRALYRMWSDELVFLILALFDYSYGFSVSWLIVDENAKPLLVLPTFELPRFLLVLNNCVCWPSP